MLKGLVVRVSTSIASVIALIAAMDVGTASAWFLYQPEAPEELRKS
ncbi:cyclic lactone autoinducer peptide [Microaerobacter geothermalis]|nr:cyclic lactone autoinducer peptide [Microaerobacter geothermalis]MCF6094494.1 cyclic lactone autoinducer peptide [Microaerobacter geothermalis]